MTVQTLKLEIKAWVREVTMVTRLVVWVVTAIKTPTSPYLSQE